MTRRWPCIVIASLCGLFALATSASDAGGAWILWERTWQETWGAGDLVALSGLLLGRWRPPKSVTRN
jgi:hypothetical protein